MPPTMVMTMERTVAKIGRSMKNWLMFTGYFAAESAAAGGAGAAESETGLGSTF
jgi:hypothetical protein